MLQSLKARGVRFPGCDNERLDHAFAPSGSASAPEAGRSLEHLILHENHVTSYTSQQTKEAFDVARNCSDLLSSVLSSSPQQNVLKVFYFAFLEMHVGTFGDAKSVNRLKVQDPRDLDTTYPT